MSDSVLPEVMTSYMGLPFNILFYFSIKRFFFSQFVVMFPLGKHNQPFCLFNKEHNKIIINYAKFSLIS